MIRLSEKKRISSILTIWQLHKRGILVALAFEAVEAPIGFFEAAHCCCKYSHAELLIRTSCQG